MRSVVALPGVPGVRARDSGPSTLGTDGWQRREVCLASAQRFAVAFVELDTLGALDELERGGDA